MQGNLFQSGAFCREKIDPCSAIFGLVFTLTSGGGSIRRCAELLKILMEVDFQQYLPLLGVLLLGFVFAGAFLLLSYSFGPKKPTASKLDVYECGVPSIGDARERFSVKFFLVAMIFLLFDVEVVFLFPWAVMLKEFKQAGIGTFAFGAMGVFLLILGLGLLYEWRRGALDWES